MHMPPRFFLCLDTLCTNTRTMSSETSLEGGEDLVGVRLVRMEDVQPRGKDCEVLTEEVLETCIIDEGDYEECLVEDDDSNIGSMVSIQSEEVVECDEESAEIIVPEIMDPESETGTIKMETTEVDQENNIELSPKTNQLESWPTLEILPGGVINLPDKSEESSSCPNTLDKTEATETGDMMYACAKCSRSFRYLFCLVKHVRWHEDEEKRIKLGNVDKMSESEKELIQVKQERLMMEQYHKRQKLEVYARIADSLGKLGSLDELFE